MSAAEENEPAPLDDPPQATKDSLMDAIIPRSTRNETISISADSTLCDKECEVNRVMHGSEESTDEKSEAAPAQEGSLHPVPMQRIKGSREAKRLQFWGWDKYVQSHPPGP